MVIFLLCLLIIMFYQVKFAPSHTFHKDYLSHKNTVLINGVFVILVYLSHSSAKCVLDGSLDGFYLLFKQHLLQLVVVTFLFYSGYGMCLSMMRKENYAHTLMTTRFPKLLLHFDIAIILYLIVQWGLGKTYSLTHILKAMIGWSSVGNSNWYIFVILLLYIFIAFAKSLNKQNNHWLTVHIITLFVVIYISIMVKKGMPTRFYNTILCFNLGMYYALAKEKIDDVVMKNDIVYACIGLVCLLLYICLFNMRGNGLLYYVLWTFVFMALVLLFSMKIKMNSSILSWFGTNIFGIYILQRIPINILCHLGVNQYTYLFIVVCFLATIVLTVMFNICLKKIDHFIFERRGRR